MNLRWFHTKDWPSWPNGRRQVICGPFHFLNTPYHLGTSIIYDPVFMLCNTTLLVLASPNAKFEFSCASFILTTSCWLITFSRNQRSRLWKLKTYGELLDDRNKLWLAWHSRPYETRGGSAASLRPEKLPSQECSECFRPGYQLPSLSTE